MIETLQSFHLSWMQWVIVLICGMMIGFTKTGISGITMLIIPVLASIFGARLSVGFLLPMLSMGDIFAVWYYNRHAEWPCLWRLLPWVIPGIGLGLLVGNYVSGEQFRIIFAVTILAGLIVMVWQEQKGEKAAAPMKWWFVLIIGLAAGFTTMIGNAAGAIISVYLLSMQMPKYAFIGTRAWFFMIVNLIKIPLHVFVWGTITLRTFSFNIALLPAIALGALIGIQVVKQIPEKAYRYIIIILTAMACIKLLI